MTLLGPALFLHVCLTICVGLPDTIRIGGLFNKQMPFTDEEVAFKFAMNEINKNVTLLAGSTLISDIQQIKVNDSYEASRAACFQLTLGVAAIVGPSSPRSSPTVQSLCTALTVPNIQTTWNPDQVEDRYSVNLYPDAQMLSQAILDMVNYYGWTRVSLLYDSDDALLRLQELLKSPARTKMELKIRKLRRGDGEGVLKDCKLDGSNKIIIDVSYEKLPRVLHKALQLGMMTHFYHYIVTSLDLGTIDLENYRHGDVNLTAFRLVDNKNPRVQEVLRDWTRVRESSNVISGTIKDGLTTSVALMFDAIYVLVAGLEGSDVGQEISLSKLSCDNRKAWLYGHTVLNYLKIAELQDGLSGRIKFDSNGQRTKFTLDVMELREAGLTKIGTWSAGERQALNITDRSLSGSNVTNSLRNKTLIVTTILEKPYVMQRRSDEELLGNDRFEGFCIDLLNEIAAILGFKYEIYLVPDGQYGAPMEDGEWSGMVKELIDQRADLAVAPLTISFIREQVIDFSKPFMNVGVTIMYRVPTRTNPGVFSFLNPLSYDIWLYILLSYLAVSGVLFVLARFSPYEWYNPHPCNPNSEYLENQFTLLNSMWFSIGAFMQQGSEIMPRALSTRLVSGAWWFFTLIMISSYTANLAAFLTVERMESPIESSDDLAKQTKIKYGTLDFGATQTFFKNSKIPTYEKMWAFMSSQEPSVFTKSTEEGIDRVLNENYAFLLESAMNEYFTHRNCNLTRVGGLLDSKGYGIGTPEGSPIRDKITIAILQLQEAGQIQMLYNKWWVNMGQCSNDDNKEASALGVANVGGIFIVLIAGLVVGILVAIIEFIWKSRSTQERDKQHMQNLSDVFKGSLSMAPSPNFVLPTNTNIIPRLKTQKNDYDDYCLKQ
ncbi:GRIK2 [Branchiostoma lanceolatum]|uniref:GRIK2 protein n=2 Tax=Branchiostoma lanceolatum TaxID=7740 RepID=A0A8J9V7E1_BRALA|nr:GRIK2 [Branchiostoma lanceolatum]